MNNGLSYLHPTELPDDEWTTEKLIDELQCNIATTEQVVTDKVGQTQFIKKYESQCIKLAPWIPIALPTPEYAIYISDLKPEVRWHLEKLSHPRYKETVLHQAVLRLFDALGIESHKSIGRKLIVKLIQE